MNNGASLSGHGTAGHLFYELAARAPESDVAWTERQTLLRAWRSDTRFEPYWAGIDQMLTDDFASFRARNAAAKQALEHPDLEGIDFDAWREQRAYDLQHAHDQLP